MSRQMTTTVGGPPASAAGRASGAPAVRPPVYARVLRLRQLRLSALLCFLFFEGAVAVAVLLALAELVSWWAVVLLPATVAAMVKLNDIVAGIVASGTRRTAGGPE